MAAHKSSAMVSGRKISSRTGPNMSQLWGKSGSSAGGNGKSTPAWIKQLKLSPCYSVRKWPGYWYFYLLFCENNLSIKSWVRFACMSKRYGEQGRIRLVGLWPLQLV